MNKAEEMVLARLHLKAILPLLEDIAAYDSTLQDYTADWNAVIQFQLKSLFSTTATYLVFSEGKLKAYGGNYPGPKVTLTFKNARQLNEVFQGKSNKTPRPNLLALLHINKLTQIEKVLGRLEHYLRPSKEHLRDKDFFAFCVKVSIYALAFGVKEVGEHDPELKVLAPNMSNGTIEIRISDGPSAHLTIQKGKFYPARGPANKPNAIMEICNLNTAWDMIQGNVDVFAAVGRGDIKLRGYIPLLEGVNPLLDRLSLYLVN